MNIECCHFLNLEVSHGSVASLTVCDPLTREGAAVFGLTHHLCHVPMRVTVILIGAGKERCSSFGSAAPHQSGSILSCLSLLLTFLLHSETLVRGAIDGSNLQQPAASHVRQST